jgi:hypothetical protein
MKTFKMVWNGGSFEPRNAEQLWDLYNENPSIQEKVDVLFSSTAVKTVDYKNRVVWAHPSTSNADEAHRCIWEIKQCGYCYSQDVKVGYTINQGFFPHMCDSCREAGCKPSL